MNQAQRQAAAKTLGPVVVDLEGLELNSRDVARITHPAAGAAILFSRNFRCVEQLEELCAAIHEARPGMIIAVDHEGGRVQRFRDGFTHVPAMSSLRSAGAEKFRSAGVVLAAELRMRGVDMTFAPVLDIDYARSGVIGDRSFGSDVDEVVRNAGAFIDGLAAAGFSCCGKHFPGHGWACADSHVALPVDERSEDEVKADCRIYKELANKLGSIMTAHIAYDFLGGETATYSSRLLKDYLREELGFDGIVFSDDLSMKGAVGDLSPAQRARLAFDAGCDMVLHCNKPEELDEILDAVGSFWARSEAFERRIARLIPKDAGADELMRMHEAASAALKI